MRAGRRTVAHRAASHRRGVIKWRRRLLIVVIFDERVRFDARRRLVNERHVAYVHFLFFDALADRFIILFYRRRAPMRIFAPLIARQTCDLDWRIVLTKLRRFAELMEAFSECNERENRSNVAAGKNVARIGQNNLKEKKCRQSTKKKCF